MKNLLIAGLVSMAALAAQADFLYWQVNTSQDAYEKGKSIQDAIADYNVRWAVPTESAYTLEAVSGAHLMRAEKTTEGIVAGSETVVGSVSKANFDSQQQWEIDVSQFGGDNYVYYIEIVANGANPYELLAVSEQLTYQDLISKNAVSAAGNEMSVSQVKIWSGGSFSAAPEPTSGLLLMIGLGLLGLKRKHA